MMRRILQKIWRYLSASKERLSETLDDKMKDCKRRATEAMKSSRYKNALKHIDEGLNTLPESKWTNPFLHIRAECLWHLERFEECLKDMRRMFVDGSPEEYNKWMARGEDLLDCGITMAAAFFYMCHRYCTTPKERARCLVMEGVATYSFFDHQRGLELIRQGKQADCSILEKISNQWKTEGISELEKRKYQRSKELLQRALIILGDDGAHWETRRSILDHIATVHFALKKYQLALDAGKKSFQVKAVPCEEISAKWNKRGDDLLHERNYDVMTKCYTLALTYAPHENSDMRAGILYKRSKVYLSQNLVAEAKNDAMFCILNRRTWLEGYKQWASCFVEEDKNQEAVNQYCKGLSAVQSDEEKFILANYIVSMAKNKGTGITIPQPIPINILKELIIQAVGQEDYETLRYLFLEKTCQHQKGSTTHMLTLAHDVKNASIIPLEMILQSDVKDKQLLALKLLDHGVSPNGGPCTRTPLELAVDQHDYKLASRILQYGAYPWQILEPNEMFDASKGSQSYQLLLLGRKARQANSKRAEMFYSLAIEYQEKAKNPEVQLESLKSLSEICLESKKYDECLRYANECQRLVSQEEGPSPIRLFELAWIRGSAHYYLRHFQEALQEGIKATRINPDNVKGYALKVSCYKDLQRPSKMLSALNECLKRKHDLEEQWKFLKEAIHVAASLPKKTTGLTAKISLKLFKRLHAEAVSSKDWNLIHLLYLGGGGPEKHRLGKGGIATGRFLASGVAIEDILLAKVKAKLEKPSVLRKEVIRQIEKITLSDTKFDMPFHGEVKLEASKEPDQAAKGPAEGVLGCESVKEENTEGNAVIQEIDETVFDDLQWEVDFSDKFRKRFRGKKIQQETKRSIVNKIIMLAQGRWTAALCKRLEGEPKQKRINLYECKLTKGARILWEKTIDFSQRCSTDKNSRVYTDIIRVWDVVMDHGDLDHEIKNVVKSIVKSSERGPQCGIKVVLKGIERTTKGSKGSGIYPSLYQKCSEETSEENIVYFPPVSAEKNEYTILKFYSFTFPVIKALLNVKEKADMNFPFKVTELEHDIINLQPEPPCPIILLGRSGTGKTTCCLYRLWTEFQKYWEQAVLYGPQFPSYTPSRANCSTRDPDGIPKSYQGSSSSVACGAEKSIGDDSMKLEHFHPLFVAKNDVLCNEVRKHFKDLINSNPVTKSQIVCERTLPNRIQDLGETSWPLILCSRDWLLLLDASLPGDSFFQRNPDGSLQNKVKGWGKESKCMRFLSVDGEDQKMREVQNVHREADSDHRPRRKPITTKHLKSELTYQVFRDDFWPKMEMETKRKIHPTLVWKEIKSFIKGSVEALNTLQGYLSRDEYQAIGRKRAPNFMGDRSAIYNLFELYQKFITSAGMFDEADLVHHLHKRLSENPEMTWSIHSVYVDETQDFTQAELSLLIRCCRYRNNMFFTGDTVQSIMKGIAFRFEDIKTLLYNLKSFDHTINVPKSLSQLTHNYRSHSGILKLASSVVRLLERFFPHSFDKLQEDTAFFDGPKPVLLESCSLPDLPLILQGNERQTSRIEFGAHQAVLVVSEEARDNIPEELKHGLVLTIYEAKGLEFDDILIFNFFKDSQAKEEWRVVSSYVPEDEQKHIQSGATGLVEIHEKDLTPTSRPLEFDYEQHKVLNTEFKLLYTAITRARVNVWFFDEDIKARGPIFEYFKRLNLVRMSVLENKEESDEASLGPSAFAERSTATQWRDKGIHFYNQKKWSLAETCFINAGDELMGNKSRALRMAEEATAKQDNDMLCAAAIALFKCDVVSKAEDCLKKADENLLLEKLYITIPSLKEAGYF